MFIMLENVEAAEHRHHLPLVVRLGHEFLNLSSSEDGSACSSGRLVLAGEL